MTAALPHPTDPGDWPALARGAEYLLALRLRDDPAAVQARKLSQLQAARREAVARAAAAIFAAISAQEDIPDLPVSNAAIADDLARTADLVARYAAGSEDPAIKAYAAALGMIAAHCRLTDAGALTVVQCHRINQQARATRAAQSPAKAGLPATDNPGGEHVNRCAARAPKEANPGPGSPHSVALNATPGPAKQEALL